MTLTSQKCLAKNYEDTLSFYGLRFHFPFKLMKNINRVRKIFEINSLCVQYNTNNSLWWSISSKNEDTSIKSID